MKKFFLFITSKVVRWSPVSWLIALLFAGLLPTLAQGQCSLSITPTVSGCYSTTAGSKATVSIELNWTNAPSGDIIIVSTGAQSRTITPGPITVPYRQVTSTATGSTTIVTPQVIAFEVDANSAVSTITARFQTITSCSATTSFTAPASCLPTPCSGTGLGGIVFKDFNDNGIRDIQETIGVPGTIVKAIACSGISYTTTTDFYGRYTLPVPVSGYPVRVEFSNVPGVYNLGVNGSDSRTTIQFVSAPDCSIDLGVSNPIDYCATTPQIFVPCFVYGDPLVAGNSATADALVSIPYGVSSLTFQGEQPLARAGQIGTTWGLAYNRSTKRLFMSAVLKRHAGLGPAGLGGIYVTNYTNPASATTTTFLSVSTLGIDVGTIATNSARGLIGDKTQPSRDNQAFALIGKIGIGDLDISEDGNTLWFVNLNDKKLYSIDITQFNQDGTTRPTAANVSSFSIPASCTNGSFRPWALKIYNGKVYVGGVCDALTTGNKSNLRASVYELTGNTFAQVFDFPLTYPKGYPAYGNRNITGWFPWTDNFDNLRDGSSTVLRHPVPMFTDIEFDVDGSMVLGFGDRTGWQGGDQNYRPDGTSTTLYETNSQAGDILRAFFSNGTFVLENNAKAGPNVGYGQGNSQGPGFGEFYNDNWLQDGSNDILYHAENIMGALALRPGTGEVVVTTIDPVDQHPFAGGVRYMNNSTGQSTGAYTVYITRGPDGSPNPGTFAKATGLGDIELSCNTITLIEIGNRVWRDDNLDGVQDACEPALAGVSVSLYRSGTLVATTTTNTNGEYYFNNNPVSSTIAGTVSNTTIQPNTAYQIVFGGATQYSNNRLTVAGNQYILTKANSSTTNANDMNDSDALIATVAGISSPVISLTSPAIGLVNHTYDVGFYQQARLGDYVFEDVNANGQQDTGIDKPIQGVTVTLLNSGTVVATTVTSTSGLYSFTGLTPGQPYSVSFSAPAGFSATTQNLGSDGTDSDGDVVTGLTGVYTLTANENNPTVDMGYFRPASLGNFVFEDKNRDGQQDAGDIPIQGVIVTLISNGTVVATTVTSTSGLYSFTGLTPGKPYSVSFTTPISFTATTSNVGNDLSDSDPVGGITAPVTLTSGENNTTLDAGFIFLPCSLTATASPSLCQIATNTYSLTGTISASNGPASQTLTVSVGTSASTVVVLSNNGPVSYTLTGMISDGTTKAVTVLSSASACGTVSTTYAAPLSCSVAPCGLSLTVTPGLCQTATNRYTLSMQAAATNVPASGTLTTSSASFSPAFTQVLPIGNSSGNFSFSGLVSNGQVFTVTSAFSNTACAPVSQTFMAPVSCSVAPVCSLTVTPTAGICQTATNTFSSTVSVQIANPGVGGEMVVTDGGLSQTISVGPNLGSFVGTAVFIGLPSNAQNRTVTVSLPGCSSTTTTYAAPESCTVCSLTVTPTAGLCQTATNTYSSTVTVQILNTGTGGTLTATDGVVSQTVLVAAGITNYTGNLIFTNLPSDGLNHIVTASLPGCSSISTTYPAPGSCSVSTPCSALLSITPGICSTLTNTYSATAVLTANNIQAPRSVTVTVAGQAQIISLTATGINTVTYELNGLVPDGQLQTATAVFSGTTCSPVSQTFMAPVSCSVAPVCSLTATPTPGLCNTATNTYSSTVVVQLTNTGAGGVLTITDGVNSQTQTVGSGLTSFTGTAVFNNLISDGQGHVITASLPGCSSTTGGYTAPLSCSMAQPCSATLDVTAGTCSTLTNTYSATATLQMANVVTPQTVTLTVGGVSSAPVALSAGANIVTFVATGLTPDGLSKLATAAFSGTACTNASITYAAPASCSAVTPTLLLTKLVSTSKAKLGDVISYTVVLVNTGPVAATSIVVNDIFTGGLNLAPGSLTVSAGSYTPGMQGGTWAIASLPAGTSATLTYSASITAEGVIYNTASIPGNEVQVCTSVPFAVCKDTPFAIALSVPDGFSRYQWYYTAPNSASATLLADGTLNSFTATLPGEYKVVVDEGLNGRCAQLACCPILIEEIEVPQYTAQGKNPTCVGTTPQANGTITLLNLGADPTVYFYQVSTGSSFSATTALPAQPTPVPANAIVGAGLANGTYTVRVWVLVDGQPSCPRDVTVTLTANCACPEEVCVPVTISKVRK